MFYGSRLPTDNPSTMLPLSWLLWLLWYNLNSLSAPHIIASSFHHGTYENSNTMIEDISRIDHLSCVKHEGSLQCYSHLITRKGTVDRLTGWAWFPGFSRSWSARLHHSDEYSDQRACSSDIKTICATGETAETTVVWQVPPCALQRCPSILSYRNDSRLCPASLSLSPALLSLGLTPWTALSVTRAHTCVTWHWDATITKTGAATVTFVA